MKENFIYNSIIKKINKDDWEIIETPQPLNDLHQIISIQKMDRIIHIEIGKSGFIHQFNQIRCHQYFSSEHLIHLATTKYFYDKMCNPLMEKHIANSYDKIILINENGKVEKWID